jgi:hypothetical protein
MFDNRQQKPQFCSEYDISILATNFQNEIEARSNDYYQFNFGMVIVCLQ